MSNFFRNIQEYTWMFLAILTLMCIPHASGQDSHAPATATYEVLKSGCRFPLKNPTMQDIQTARIRLANGLEAYLVSDPLAKQSSAAVVVHTGSWDDPEVYPGMAHFVEHVLFMGTKAYPAEGEYSKFIHDHHGTYNAYTASSITSYMFAIQHDHFVGALDRLSHFFIDPLLNLSCIERELHAVNQEHHKNIERDGYRQMMVLKATGNPGHPFAQFSTGNADTLRAIPEESLRRWYGEHYYAKNMRVVVMAPLSLEKLAASVVDHFAAVPADPLCLTTPTPKTDLFSAQQKGHTIYIKPVRNVRTLGFTWQLPPTLTDIDGHHVASFVSKVLGSTHSTSLLEQLKKEQFANHLRSECFRLGPREVLLNIEVDLTLDGLRSRDRVAEYVFQALQQLRSADLQPCFAEMQRMSLLHHQYQVRTDAFQLMMLYSHGIFDEDLETFPEATTIPEQFSEEKVHSLLCHLVPQECIFDLSAPEDEVGMTAQYREKWSGAEYTLVPIARDTLRQWSVSTGSGFCAVPPPNPFIPERLALVVPPHATTSPHLLVDDAYARIYFQQDSLYQVPEAALHFRLHSPVLNGSPRGAALAALFCQCFQDILAEVLDQASIANLHADLAPGKPYLTLSICGFSEKMPTFTNSLFSMMQHILPSKERFIQVHDWLRMTYLNASRDLPVDQARKVMHTLVFNGMYSDADKLCALNTISYEDFLSFSRKLFKQVYLEGVMYGNYEEKEARRLCTQFRLALGATPCPAEDIVCDQVRVLPACGGPFLMAESTESLGKATLLLLQGGPARFPALAAHLVLVQALHDDFFDTLRTKQQTGYIARSKSLDNDTELMLYFEVLSTTHQPRELLARFDLFLENYMMNFEQQLSHERFERIRSSAIAYLRMPQENLYGKAVYLKTMAFEHHGNFEYDQKLIEALVALDYSSLKKYAESVISRHNTRRLAILVEGTSPPEGEFAYKQVARSQIASLGQWGS